jgi:hypothetical protein
MALHVSRRRECGLTGAVSERGVRDIQGLDQVQMGNTALQDITLHSVNRRCRLPTVLLGVTEVVR